MIVTPQTYRSGRGARKAVVGVGTGGGGYPERTNRAVSREVSAEKSGSLRIILDPTLLSPLREVLVEELDECSLLRGVQPLALAARTAGAGEIVGDRHPLVLVAGEHHRVDVRLAADRRRVP